MNTKLTGVVILILSLIVMATIYAMPNDREKQYIRFGELKQEQKQLHTRNEALRNEIEENKRVWQEVEDVKGELEAELFQ